MWKRKASLKLHKLLKQFPCVCVLGARQVGKTTLVKTTFPKAGYFDLESPSIQDRVALGPEMFLRSQSMPLVLDEAQSITSLMQSLKVVIDENPQKTGRFIITGSASPALMKKASETLAGRIGFLDLDPLTKTECAGGDPVLSLQDIWFRGGYPLAARESNQEKRSVWFASYNRTFIERDLPRLGIEIQPDLMRKLMLMVAHTHGGIWNASQLGSSAGVSFHTVSRYLQILEQSFLVRTLPSYHVNIGKRLVKSPKIYLRDSGLYHFLMNIGSYDALINSPYCGKSFEGFIIEELIREGSLHYLPPHFFYYRTQSGLESDLVIETPEGRSVVEIKFGERLEQQYFKKLKAVMADINAKHGFIINTGEKTYPISEDLSVVSANDKHFPALLFAGG